MPLTRLALRCWTLIALLSSAIQVSAEPLLIGAEDDWYPYTALRNGQIQGMSVDIVKAAFAATDTEIVLRSYP